MIGLTIRFYWPSMLLMNSTTLSFIQTLKSDTLDMGLMMMTRTGKVRAIQVGLLPSSNLMEPSLC